MEKELNNYVWLMSGFIISYNAGRLWLKDDRVTLITRKGKEFDVPLNEVKTIKWPKLQMGFGVHIEVNGKTYKITFGQPQGETTIDEQDPNYYNEYANMADSINRIGHLKDYKANANAWREVLGG